MNYKESKGIRTLGTILTVINSLFLGLSAIVLTTDSGGFFTTCAVVIALLLSAIPSVICDAIGTIIDKLTQIEINTRPIEYIEEDEEDITYQNIDELERVQIQQIKLEENKDDKIILVGYWNCPKCNREINNQIDECKCGYKKNKRPNKKSKYKISEDELGYWKCPECDEENPGESDKCWCGYKRK